MIVFVNKRCAWTRRRQRTDRMLPQVAQSLGGDKHAGSHEAQRDEESTDHTLVWSFPVRWVVNLAPSTRARTRTRATSNRGTGRFVDKNQREHTREKERHSRTTTLHGLLPVLKHQLFKRICEDRLAFDVEETPTEPSARRGGAAQTGRMARQVQPIFLIATQRHRL